MKRLFATLCVGVLVVLPGTALAQFGARSAAPAPTGTAGSGFETGGFWRYVAPGQSITILIASVSDMDTDFVNCLPVLINDELVEGVVVKVGNGVAGNWASKRIKQNSSAYVSYTVPANAQTGDTFQLCFYGRDTRFAAEWRHDGWTCIQTWDFAVRSVDLMTLSVDSITQDTAYTNSVPAGQTRGKATVRMVAGPSTIDWDGTVVTEELGLFQGNNNALAPGAQIAGVLHPNGGYDASFTVGDAGHNKFDDFLIFSSTLYCLKSTVLTTTLTHQHDYLSGGKRYGFTGEHMFAASQTAQGQPCVKVIMGMHK